MGSATPASSGVLRVVGGAAASFVNSLATLLMAIGLDRDKRDQTPFLMTAGNEMDPGDMPAHLPELTQVEEMIIARSHVQMMDHRYRGHQYHYSGHCVSFMQSTVNAHTQMHSFSIHTLE